MCGNIGNVLMLRKKYEEAVPQYKEVLLLSKGRSTLSTAHHSRGCAYYEWGETLNSKVIEPHRANDWEDDEEQKEMALL